MVLRVSAIVESTIKSIDITAITWKIDGDRHGQTSEPSDQTGGRFFRIVLRLSCDLTKLS